MAQFLQNSQIGIREDSNGAKVIEDDNLRGQRKKNMPEILCRRKSVTRDPTRAQNVMSRQNRAGLPYTVAVRIVAPNLADP